MPTRATHFSSSDTSNATTARQCLQSNAKHVGGEGCRRRRERDPSGDLHAHRAKQTPMGAR